ncbi:FRG domain-containing protein [Proteiniclasticum sp. C24MP]|uniref:FRG domain-containing protein n=1 Tax=Proteiniclasticum sp. C24MP TaxID=3374101 RepID=UPI0037549B5F
MFLKTAEDVVQVFEKLNNESNFFRGYKDYDYHMKPSLGRGDYIEFEILHSYYNSNKQKIEFNTFVDVIEHAQHYGEKTRLLDWTSSPWVALYFANFNCRNNEELTYLAVLNSEIPSYVEVPDLPITLSLIDEFTLGELDQFTLDELDKFMIEGNTKYLSNIKFKALYDNFIESLPKDKYLVNRYSDEQSNSRKKSQKGLFTFHKDPKAPMGKKDFDLYTLELPKEEKVKLLDIISEKYGVNGITLGFGVN